MTEIPSTENLIESSHVVSLPLRTGFRGLVSREVMLFEGEYGPAEWAPFTEYSDDIAARWLAAALEQGFGRSIRARPSSFESIAVNATFPSLSPKEISHWWQYFPGVQSAKIKVAEQGQHLLDDVERVAELRRTVGPNVTIRLDANARWTVDQAAEALEKLEEFSIDYVEQPVATTQEMVDLRQRLRGTGIRLAADELIRHSHALDELIAENAADIAVLKVSPLGGIGTTRSLAIKAHNAGMEVVISSALESSVGLSWGVRAAALLQDEIGGLADAGLGTAAFFTSDTTTKPLEISNGTVSVSEPVLDYSSLKQHAASSERIKWWHERLERCLPLAVTLLKAHEN